MQKEGAEIARYHGGAAPATDTSLCALDYLRATIGLAEGGACGSNPTLVGARAAVEDGLIWCKVDPHVEVAGTKTLRDELRAFPSRHTCFVANVVAAPSLLLQGRASRFATAGCFPPVYLACSFNFDRDTRWVRLAARHAVV